MNPNLEFHKQKLAEILESHERGEAKTYTFEEFKSLQDKHIFAFALTVCMFFSLAVTANAMQIFVKTLEGTTITIEVEPRREFIEANAKYVSNLDIYSNIETNVRTFQSKSKV